MMITEKSSCRLEEASVSEKGREHQLADARRSAQDICGSGFSAADNEMRRGSSTTWK